jgi:hypothetical protein
VVVEATAGFQQMVNSVCVRTQAELKRRGIALRARYTPTQPVHVKNVHVLLPLESGAEDKVVGALVRDLALFKEITSYPAQAPTAGLEDGAVVAYEGLIIRGLLGYDMVGSRYLVRFDVYVTEGDSDGAQLEQAGPEPAQ